MPRCPAGSPSTAAASAGIRSTRRSCSCRDLSRELRNRNRVTVTVVRWLGRYGVRWRSEEHTSELQSRSDLVCRLLLEKKKKKEETAQGCIDDTLWNRWA